MNVFFFCYREIAILAYLSIISIFSDSFMVARVTHELLSVGPGLGTLFVTISLASNIALYFAFMDFKPKAKVIMAKNMLWSPFIFLLSLFAFLASAANLATSVGLIWFFADQLF